VLPVLGLVVGGVLVAPFAAQLAGRLPHAPMGTLVGGLVILVNGVTIVASLGGLPGWLDALLMGAVVAVTSWVAWRAWQREKGERRTAALVDA
jgi:predicted lipid-binding transport protein (Tim44 family)